MNIFIIFTVALSQLIILALNLMSLESRGRQIVKREQEDPQIGYSHTLLKASFLKSVKQAQQVKIELDEEVFPSVRWLDQRNSQLSLGQGQLSHHFCIPQRKVKQKYKRSTNNSHKKFITTAKKCLFKYLGDTQREAFERKYHRFKTCRTYFFIILANASFCLTGFNCKEFKRCFIEEMEAKIAQYRKEISKNQDKNLRNFRDDQIVDIKYSIAACQQYFDNGANAAIQCMYKRNKSTIVKKQNYNTALKLIQSVEKQLQNSKTGADLKCLQQLSLEEESQKQESMQSNSQVVSQLQQEKLMPIRRATPKFDFSLEGALEADRKRREKVRGTEKARLEESEQEKGDRDIRLSLSRFSISGKEGDELFLTAVSFKLKENIKALLFNQSI